MKGASNLSERAYRQLKNMFLTDQLVSGQKLPYQDLAKRLDMSQTPVMMALVRLEYEGLVRSEANKGFYVPALDLNEAKELYGVRLLLEVHLMPSVIENMCDERLSEVESLLEAHRQVRGPVYKRERLLRDADFHLGIAAVSGNLVIGSILGRVFDLLYLRYKPEILSALRQDEAEVEHLSIFEALRGRDPSAAAGRLREHIARGRDRILTGLQEEEVQRRTIMERTGEGAFKGMRPHLRGERRGQTSIG
jgi:DNA-binding GntR family transcriptional regulator